MKKVVACFLIGIFVLFTTGCASHLQEGGIADGILGGIAGALIDHKNPWRGAVIGSAIGGATGAVFADISVRASEKALKENKAVIERNNDKVVLAEPLPSESTECKKVRIREWKNNTLTKDETKEICNSQKTEKGYLN